MARKDVDLIIRAKDEATKVVDSITTAINEFVEAQSDLTRTAGKTGSTLQALGASLGLLDKELRGFSAPDKIASELNKASVAAERLKAEFADTQAEAAKLATAMRHAEGATERLTAKAKGAARAQADAATSLERARKAQADLTTELTKTTATRDRLLQQEGRLSAAVEKQAQRVAETAARYNRLQAEIAATTGPTKTLQSRLESVGTSLAKQTQRLEELRGKYEATQDGIQNAADGIGELKARMEGANASVARQERIVGKIAENYKKLETTSKAAARHQRDVADAVDRTGDVLERQAQRIDKASTELIQLSAAAGKADAAMTELAAQSGQALQQAFAASRKIMQDTRAEWIQASKAARELAAAIDIIGPPTRQQVVELGRLRTQADAAEAAMRVQANAMVELRGILEQTGGTVEELRARQERFVAIQAETAAALNKIQAEAKQTAESYDQMAAGAQRAATQTRKVAGPGTVPSAAPIDKLAQAYERLYGKSRQAMSITQRLRGEVLSLVSAYAGIFGVITTLDKTLKATQNLEAAQARLNVAFEGDKRIVGEELDFIRRTANRLGLEFGNLADEYSKFSIATQGTALAGQNTRNIFVSVAEAARVARISNEDLQGVFKALTQIVSKGAVQLEELKGQLGDRLPGAMQIMADGLGITTAELIKMTEQGQLTSDALIPFARELDKRFGPGLAEALQGTTKALGDLGNAAFQALLQFGQAGFLDGFRDLLNDLVETMRSADFQAFAARASQAFGTLAQFIGYAVRNFDALVIAASAWVGVRLTPFILGLVARLGALRTALIAAATGTTTMGNVMAGTAGKITRTAAAVNLLTIAFRGLLSATGVGLAITAITTAIGWWATRADEATEAMNAHQKIVDAVKNAYDKAGGSVKNWAEAIEEVTVTQATANLQTLEKSAEDARKALRGLATGTGVAHLTGEAKAQAVALRDLARQYEETGGDVKEFKDKVEAIAEVALDDSIKAYALELQNAADEITPFNKAIETAKLVLTALTGTTEEAQKAMDTLMGKTEETARTMPTAAEKSKLFRDELQKIKDIIPEINSSLDDLKESKALEEQFQAAVKLATTMGEVNAAIDAYNQGMSRVDQQVFAGGQGNLVDKIIGVESAGRANAKNPASSATGLGQFIESTWLRMFKKYFVEAAQGMTDSAILELRYDPKISREMVGLLAAENATALRNAGVAAINDASLYLAHFLGQQGAISIMRAAPGTPVSQLLQPGQITANQSILQGKTAREVYEWAMKKMNVTQAELDIQTQLGEIEQDKLDKSKEANADTEERILGTQQEISQQQLINAGKAREAEIEKAIADARKENPNITAEQIQRIRETTGALFDLQQVKELDKANSKEAEAAMQRVNALLAQRTALEQQLKLAKEAGDTGKVQETEQAIVNLNTQLDEAIAKARAMWEAIGGSVADANLIKLDTAAIKAGNLAAKAQQNLVDWGRVGDLFASGLTNAFDRFAQAVANGEDVGEAAKQAFLEFASEFLRQIAQMIIQQAILNALQSFGFGSGGSGLGGAIAGIFHEGGVVGRDGGSRRVNPMIFANARRFHNGGIPGLRPGEVPAILQRREEVLTEDDPRHMLNQPGPAAAPVMNFKNVNAFDAPGFLEAALADRSGEQVLLNFVSANPAAFKRALGG